MKLIKQENGNVHIMSASANIIAILPPSQYCRVSGSIVTIKGLDNEDIILYPDKITATQVLPNAEVAFSGTVQDLATLLSSSFFFRVTSSGGGTGDNPIIEGATPPSNTGDLWLNTGDNLTYYYDSTTSEWKSFELFEMEFSKRNRLNNNAFLRHGNTNTSLTHGVPVEFKSSLVSGSYNKRGVNTGTLTVYSNSGQGSSNAIAFGNVTVSASLTGSQLVAGVTSNIDANSFVSVRWSGSTITDPKFILKYRKVHTP